MSDLHKLAAVLIGILIAMIVGVGLAQNLRCPRCGSRRADCECPGEPP